MPIPRAGADTSTDARLKSGARRRRLVHWWPCTWSSSVFKQAPATQGMHIATLRAFVRCAANWQALQDRELASAEWVGQLLGKERSGKCNTPAADAINAAIFGTSGSGLRVVQVDGSTDL
eukprot:796591-Prymnesium_polylepis.3